MDRQSASDGIEQVFAVYRSRDPDDRSLLDALTDGKLYELYVLSHVVQELASRGFALAFQGTTLRFKSGPGMIRPGDAYFEVSSPSGAVFRLYVDIEFTSLGSVHVAVTDNSARHEIDLVVTDALHGYPTHDQILLGVECKAVAKFSKSIVKEVLGVRRELSYLASSQSSRLSSHQGWGHVVVPADPPSEYWLAYTDPAGHRYRESPSAFGIEFMHLQP